MKNDTLTILLLLAGLAACKTGADKQGTSTSTQSNDTKFIPNGQSSYCFFKTFDGNIGAKAIIMNLLKVGNKIDANFYYEGQGQPIFLSNKWDEATTDGSFLVSPSFSNADSSATLSLLFKNDSLVGTWTAADRATTFPIRLKEGNNADALRFIAFNYTDSAKYLKFKTDTPMINVSTTIVAAVSNNNRATWLNNRLKSILDGSNEKFSHLNLTQTATTLAQQEINEYTADVDSSIVGINPQNSYYFLNRSYETLGNIIYNNNSYVVTSLFNYAYTGGAHGNYGTSIYCFDVNAQKQLALSDIITADSATLQTIIETHYRQQYNIQPTTPLEQRLLVKHLSASNNFYFGPGGLGFIYQPYEVAPYAEGEINVWMPFAALKPYLTPRFAKQMKL